MIMELFAAEALSDVPSGNRFRRPILHNDHIRCYNLLFPAGETVEEHAHLRSDEVFLFRSGRARIFIRTSLDAPSVLAATVKAGDVVLLAAGEYHTLVVDDGPLEVLAIVTPNLDDNVTARGDGVPFGVPYQII